MAEEKFKYHFLKYNRYHVLRPNFLLYCVLIYFLKDVLLVFAIGATAFKGGGPSTELSAMVSLASPRMLLASIPAVLLSFALIQRAPTGSDRIRWIWRNGRHLILVAAVLHAALVLINPLPERTQDLAILGAILGLNVVAVAYVYMSEFVGDVFAQFPAKPAEPEAGT